MHDQPLICRLEEETGRTTHQSLFVYGVYSDNVKMGEGSGRSKADARIAAAENAVVRFFGKRKV